MLALLDRLVAAVVCTCANVPPRLFSRFNLYLWIKLMFELLYGGTDEAGDTLSAQNLVLCFSLLKCPLRSNMCSLTRMYYVTMCFVKARCCLVVWLVQVFRDQLCLASVIRRCVPICLSVCVYLYLYLYYICMYICLSIVSLI